MHLPVPALSKHCRRIHYQSARWPKSIGKNTPEQHTLNRHRAGHALSMKRKGKPHCLSSTSSPPRSCKFNYLKTSCLWHLHGNCIQNTRITYIYIYIYIYIYVCFVFLFKKDSAVFNNNKPTERRSQTAFQRHVRTPRITPVPHGTIWRASRAHFQTCT